MLLRLKELRRILELNQTDFAKQLGITQTAYSMIESGSRPFTEKYIKLICSIFGVSEQWLRTGNGEMFLQSPYEKDFMQIFDLLTPETQEYLYDMAKGLLKTQEKLLNKNSE